MEKTIIADAIKSHLINGTWEAELLPLKKLYAYYQCALMEVETKFNVLNTEMNVYYDKNPIEVIKTRVKRLDSVVKKLNKRGLPITVDSIEENIHDIAGIRVVCTFEQDIYRIVDAFTRQDDIRVLKIKDYIKDPKLNGYRSLHLIIEIPIFLYQEKKFIKVEVQVRTLAMDVWASLEHKIRYKKNLAPAQEAYLEKILLDCANYCHEIDSSVDLAIKELDACENKKEK